ncbi:hypothetical protein [Paenibacillus lautus]|uniref:hypothetical protein n=1 Tax=Paenibacillus lautus TaxID=1401 RepID=UPI003D2B93BD
MESSYSGQLHSTGLFETHEKVNLKLKAIETLAKVDGCNVSEAIGTLAIAVMNDLGIVWNEEKQAYVYVDVEVTFSDLS